MSQVIDYTLVGLFDLLSDMMSFLTSRNVQNSLYSPVNQACHEDFTMKLFRT